ncbi:MAG: hypothetical protein R3Y51_05290, partial [Rikenellaceae bacterium]
PSKEFSPLIISPNLNIELSSFSETFEELMSFPNYAEFAEEFAARIPKLYIANGYSEETNINNMIAQLLIMEGYVNSDDLSRGNVIEKVNRETIAAAKYAVVKFLDSKKPVAKKTVPAPKTEAQPAETEKPTVESKPAKK